VSDKQRDLTPHNCGPYGSVGNKIGYLSSETMRVNMRYACQLLAFLSLAVGLTAQSKLQSAKIESSSVWELPPQFMTMARAVCDQTSSSSYGDCMIGQMADAGAPADAVRFSRELYKENHSEFGVMTGFQQESPISFALVTYPLRANTNYGLLLVNGQPRILNIEDPRLLDVKTMKKSPRFQDLKRQFPNIDVWPGDRDGKTWPSSHVGPTGLMQFTVRYPLIDGCHACARAGTAIFNWNFDARGKFLGTSFQGMVDPPL
jgi:hypothetical protein